MSTPEQSSSTDTTDGQMLDRIYHALPDWVRQTYYHEPLDVRVARGFEACRKNFETSIVAQVQENAKMREFVVWLCKTHGLDFGQNYWNFLISKDLANAKTEEEKQNLIKMQKKV